MGAYVAIVYAPYPFEDPMRLAVLVSVLPLSMLLLAGCSSDDAPVSVTEPEDPSWQQIHASNAGHVYMAGVLVSELGYTPPYSYLLEVGTAFRVAGGDFYTNAHVALAMHKLGAMFLPQWAEKPYETRFVLVQSGSAVDEFLSLESFALHPSFDTSLESVDLAHLTLSGLPKNEGGIPIAAATTLSTLTVGQSIATIGFPGETQYYNYRYPVATLKQGIISALRPLRWPFTPDSTAYMVQYDLDLTGGTSGSPVLNADGELIAVNYAGYDRGSINFGIRADLLEAFAASPPTTLFDNTALYYETFLLTPGAAVGELRLGAAAAASLATFSHAVGSIAYYTDSLSYIVQVYSADGVARSLRLYPFDYDLFDPPFYTDEYLGAGADLARINTVYDPSQIAIHEVIRPGDTITVTEVRSRGIAFVHDSYHDYIEEIFVFPPDSAPNYDSFIYEEAFLPKMAIVAAKKQTQGGTRVIRIPPGPFGIR